MPFLSDDVRDLKDGLVELRRDLHRHPELAFQEKRTAARVAAFLEGAGLEVRTGVGGTGVLARKRYGSGPTVLLRVDMDALPLQERSAVPYASSVPGVMHACGHDGHTAIGAAAARVLARRALPGEVRLLFQPAEEGEGGAQAVIADGALQGVDLVLGIHLWNELDVGTLGVKPGPLMAAVDRLRITVRGEGGHGGKPHRAADPIVAAAHVVTALQSIVAREVPPVEAAVVTVGAIHGGQAFNVIPDAVELLGTLRTFDPALRRELPGRVARIAEGVAGALRCRAEVAVTNGNPAVHNDPAVAALARRAAARVVGEEKVVEPVPTMGGEDMAVYFEKAPGCFVFVGSANRERGLDHDHHSPSFDFDEEALLVGCEFLVQAAEMALREGLPPRRP
jgi:amidohydrolase